MHNKFRERMDKTIFGEHLSPQNLSLLAAQATAIDLDQGQYLFREGQSNHYVYVMLEGQVDLLMSVPGRGAQRILSLGDGDLVAWSAVLAAGTMTCSAVCVRPARLLALDCHTLQDLMGDNPQLGYEFMKAVATALAKRLLATRLQLLDLFVTSSVGA
ncbi:MAG: cyclic nucleotide-binding domain-containing protein [Pirellulaceae bacterium]|nr:cyclic nucleotide-binding domain-containing protein [Pirellulaceae bacterium]